MNPLRSSRRPTNRMFSVPSRSSSRGSAWVNRSRSTPFGMISYSPGKYLLMKCRAAPETAIRPWSRWASPPANRFQTQ